jgi:phosphopantothenoylcysteine synthetase/decarboxylase
MSRVLYIISCAAPPARQLTRLIEPAQQDGWEVCVLATPSAVRFIDPAALEAQTGHPVRSSYKEPGTPDVLPPPDAIIVAPATVNTINKWACGICDTLPLGILVEAIGKKLPTVVLPFTNQAHAAHPAFGESIEKLRSWGVHVLYGPDVYPLHPPGTGSDHLDSYPWHLALESLNHAATAGPA